MKLKTRISVGGAIKAVGDNGFEGYLVRFNTDGTRDLHDEWFSPRTEFKLDDFPVKGSPALFHHGLTDELGVDAVGRITDAKLDDFGLFVRGVYNERKRYIDYIKRMVEDGILSFSSGALPQSVKTAKNGHIDSWCVVEASFTHTPADWRSVIDDDLGTLVTSLKAAAAEALKGVNLSPKEAQSKQQADDVYTAKADDLTSTDSNSPTGETDMLDETLVQAIRDEIVAELIRRGVVSAPEAEAPAVEEIIEEAVDEAASEVMAEVIEETADDVEEDVEEAVEEELSDETLTTIASRAVAKAVAKLSKRKNGKRSAISAGVRNGAKGSLRKAFEDDAQPVSKLGGRRYAGETAKSAGGRVSVTGKYDRLSPEDIAFMALLLSGSKKGYVLSPEMMRALADKTVKAAASGKRVDGNVLKTAYAVKADELDHTTNTGYGEEWVAEAWSTQLWERTRLEDVVVAQFDPIDMPSPVYHLPLEGADPIVYAVPETTDASQLTLANEAATAIPSSKIGTGNLTLTAVKLAARVGWSAELNEDSVIPIAPQFRRQMERALMDAVAGVILFADSETSGNINYAGGTASRAIGNWFVDNDGIMKYALNNTASRGVDMEGAAPTLAMIRELRALLPVRYAARPQDLVILTDYQTYFKLLNIPEVLTVDKFGDNATVITGELAKIDGIPVVPTYAMPLASSTGKISSTANQNTFGRLALVYKPGVVTGYRRETNITVEFLSYYDAYMMTGTVRPAVLSYANDVVVVAYNIGV